MNRIAILLAGALLAGTLSAQETAPREKARSFTFVQNEPGAVFSANPDLMFQREALPGQVEFFSTEVAAAGETITGAPYSATAVTETTQTLADGNHIVNKSSGLVARDSQGRTRRETLLHRIGPLSVDAPKTFFINDPVTHTQYVITGNEGTKIARNEQSWKSNPALEKLTAEQGVVHERKIVTNGVVQDRTIVIKPGAEEKSADLSKAIKQEDLGTQTIEGVSAQGRRDTITIPAGQIGNERPIEIVTEIWTSPELHTVVLRKHSDPRSGETVFRLTNISRSEPDPSLFQPPAGVKFRTGQTFEFKHESGQPKE
jgi:hypothetical protein